MSHKSIEALINTVATLWDAMRSESNRGLYQIRVDWTLDQSILELLSAQSERKVYWRSRDGHDECVGLGKAIEVTTSKPEDIPNQWDRLDRLAQQGDTSIRLFGGTAFDTQQAPDPLWRSMGLLRFWVPRLMLQRDRDRVQWVISTESLDEASLAQTVHLLTSALGPRLASHLTLPKFKSLRYGNQPTRSEWLKRVADVTSSLAQEDGKVVLCVQQSHEMENCIEGAALFQQIRSQCGGGFQYYFEINDMAFLGVSPECLYDRHAACLTTEALAGTAKFDRNLLDTPKENCEHDFVIRDMKEALAGICTNILCQPEKELVRWQDLVHLKTGLAGTVRAGVTDTDIIRALHPSAAVLGYPRDRAWQWLRRHEDHTRGWYAGPVGWFDRDRAQFAVAIRCAVVASSMVHLYGGAGLVQASQPAEEWLEVQNKMRLLNEILA